MSSNNILIIRKSKKGFEIHHNLCVDNPFRASKKTLLKIRPSLIKAIKYAQRFCSEYPYVEYGYFIELNALTECKKRE